MTKKIVALFPNEKEASQGIAKIRQLGYQNEISLMAKGTSEENSAITMGQKDNTDYEQYPYLDKTKKTEATNWTDYPEKNNVTRGTLGGGIAGGLGGLAVSVGALTIPGIGPLIAAGPIAAILSGAVIGGITGALADWGIPQAQSADYENKLKEGKALVGTEIDQEDIQKVVNDFRSVGADEVKVY